MRYLADTNVILWYIQGDIRLSQNIRDIISNTENTIFLSVASIWEISIKYSLGQLELLPDLDSWLDKYLLNEVYTILPVHINHARLVAKLPFHHRDPFDRLIFAQSVAENIELLYTDVIFDKYKNS